MDRGKLKNIVKSLQSLLDVLESEVYSDVDAYRTNGNNHAYTQGETTTMGTQIDYSDEMMLQRR